MSERLLSGPFLRATLANFFFFLNFASYFLLPLFLHSLGGSEATIGAVMGSSGLASLLVLPLVGMTIDRFGRRPFLLAGAATMTVASVGFQFVHAIGPAVFALRVLQGVSFAAAFTATTTFAAEFAPRPRRARALGLFGLSTLLTHAIAPGLGEELVRRAGFPALFAAAMLCTMVVLVIALPLPEPRHHAQPVAVGARRLQPIHWIIAVTMTLAGMGFGSVMTFIPTFVTTHNLGRVGYFFAAYTSTAILTRLVGAGASDRFGRQRVILPALLLLGVSIFWLARVEDLATLFAAGALFGTAQGISYPTLHAFLVDVATEAQLGRTQALFNGAFNLGVTGSAFAFGLVAEQWGYRVMFSFAALTPIAAAAVFLVGTRQPRRGV
ncbi:MAG TPA: MFS transporter [Candidatus Dormibacteraeota bacterium]|nr:MFS transporter [Candidatus Dormibacteraeota bacterium]